MTETRIVSIAFLAAILVCAFVFAPVHHANSRETRENALENTHKEMERLHAVLKNLTAPETSENWSSSRHTSEDAVWKTKQTSEAVPETDSTDTAETPYIDVEDTKNTSTLPWATTDDTHPDQEVKEQHTPFRLVNARTDKTTQTVKTESGKMDLTRYDIYVDEEQYTEFEVVLKDVKVGKATYPLMSMNVGPIHTSKLVKLSQKAIENLRKTPESLTDAMTDPMPTFDWHGIEFVRFPGNGTTLVEYDHPNNYEKYHPNESNINYSIEGTDTFAIHIPEYQIYLYRLWNDAGCLAAAFIGLGITLLTLPEPIVSKITASALISVGAAVMLFHQTVAFFIDQLETEMGDGWIYFGKRQTVNILDWTINYFWISFGPIYDVKFPIFYIYPKIAWSGTEGDEIIGDYSDHYYWYPRTTWFYYRATYDNATNTMNLVYTRSYTPTVPASLSNVRIDGKYDIDLY